MFSKRQRNRVYRQAAASNQINDGLCNVISEAAWDIYKRCGYWKDVPENFPEFKEVWSELDGNYYGFSYTEWQAMTDIEQWQTRQAQLRDFIQKTDSLWGNFLNRFIK